MKIAIHILSIVLVLTVYIVCWYAVAEGVFSWPMGLLVAFVAGSVGSQHWR